MIQSPVKGNPGSITEASRRIIQQAGTDTCGPAVAKRLLFDLGGDKVSQHVLNQRMMSWWRKPGYSQAKALTDAMNESASNSKWSQKNISVNGRGDEPSQESR